MKKVLYISNIEVPYRVRFLNELAKQCDLTVLYERKRSSNREKNWAKSTEGLYRTKYLRGIKIGGEYCFSFGILKEIFSKYDCIIIGCYSSVVQMMATLTMRLFRKKYCINLDGEPFLEEDCGKTKLKRFFLRGADKYLVAGHKAAESVRKIAGEKEIIPYHFSSLSKDEIQAHVQAEVNRTNDTALVIGQYFDYKGMDIALKAAEMDPEQSYKFVGMGVRTSLFEKDFQIPQNVQIVPFLQKEELEQEYRNCSMLVLPSRRECWGLVVNEAASFGMPIVSTWGSGAAREFLADAYPQFLATPEDPADLLRCIQLCRSSDQLAEYSAFLRKKSLEYHIEQNVQAHIAAIADRQ
jgi:glycosyltransferase involved in cell wall biosynthesis